MENSRMQIGTREIINTGTPELGKINKLNSFGDFLRKQQLIIKKDRNKIARELGVSYQTVSGWETCTKFPGESKLPAIAIVYGVSLEELIKAFQISRDVRNEEIFKIKSALQLQKKSVSSFTLPASRGSRTNAKGGVQ